MVKIFATFFFAFLFPLLTLTAQPLVSPDKKVALKTNHLGNYSEIITIIKNYK